MSNIELNIFDKNDRTVRPETQISKKIIGYFSVNEKVTYCADARQLKYVHYDISHTKDLQVHFDLNFKPHCVIKKNDKKTWDKLTHMFIWLSLNSPRLCLSDQIAFLCFRGTMTKIMCSPYLERDDWTICARFCPGLIYLNWFDTEQDITKRQSASEFQLKCETWGFRFEQFMLTDNPKKKPNPNNILNENTEFNCVFDGQLGSHRIIYGAEMDGIQSENLLEIHKDTDDLTKLEFVELKTSGIVNNHQQESTLRRYKMLKWWCQSYLVGIETIICGFRDYNGKVKFLRRYKVNELPNLAKEFWSSHVCINFCDRFLNFIKHIVLENSQNDGDVWKFDLILKSKTIRATKVIEESSIYKSGFRAINTVM